MIWRLHDWLKRDSVRHGALKVLEAHIRNRPEEWEIGGMYATRGDIALWIASGRGYLRLHRGKNAHADDLGILWRWRIWSVLGPRVRDAKRVQKAEAEYEKATLLVDKLDPMPGTK